MRGRLRVTYRLRSNAPRISTQNCSAVAEDGVRGRLAPSNQGLASGSG